MTPEHDESEELYQQLRRKLDGYGSDPSEAVWAAIQQQLPPPPGGAPPPAAPPAGPRYSWPWKGVAAVLGVGVLLTVLWLLWPQLRRQQVARESGTPRTEAAVPAGSGAAGSGPAGSVEGSAAPGTAAPAGSAAESSTARGVENSAAQPSGADNSAVVAGSSAKLAQPSNPLVAARRSAALPSAANRQVNALSRPEGPRPAGATAVAPAPDRPRQVRSATPGPATASARRAAVGSSDTIALSAAPRNDSGTSRAADTAAIAASGPSRDAPSAANASASSSPTATDSAAAAVAEAPRSARLPAAVGAGAYAPHRPTGTAAASTMRVRTEGAAATKTAASRSAKRRQAGQGAARDETRAAVAGPNARRLRRTSRAGVAAEPNGQAARRQGQSESENRQLAGIALAPAWAPLALRPTALPTLPAPPPATPQRVPADSVRRPKMPHRWALQALAGPTITHRRLVAGEPRATVQLQDLERPAVAFAGQLQAGYALSGRVQLLAGVGYAAYAQRLNFTVRQRSVYDTTTTERRVSQRDVRQFLTVPVGLRYELGQRPRLRYAAVVGAAPVMALGGQVSTGTPCACETEPYSSTQTLGLESIVLSAGLEARYQVAPRWQWLVQPTFTYSLFAIDRRHLWSTGLLTGLSYNLR